MNGLKTVAEIRFFHGGASRKCVFVHIRNVVSQIYFCEGGAVSESAITYFVTEDGRTTSTRAAQSSKVELSISVICPSTTTFSGVILF